MDNTPTPPPDRAVLDGGGEHAQTRRLPWALRIALAVLIWIPQPWLALNVMFGAIKLPDWYGFLGGWGVIAAVGVFLVALTGLVLRAGVGRNRRETAAWAGACLVAAVLLVANHVKAQGLFVESDSFDWQTAREIEQANPESNLADGPEAYRPFESNLIARLDEPSALAFSPDDELPRVDSATALLPLASSLVTATYPEAATTVQWELGDFDEGFTAGYLSGYANGATEKMQGNAPDDHIPADAEGILDRPDYRRAFNQAYDQGFIAGYNAYEEGKKEAVRLEEAKPMAQEALKNAEKPVGATFQFNNSTEGFTRLADGRTDVFFGTKADEGQAAYARGIGVEFDYTPVGREGFVFLVNADNPVDSLTVEQVKGIYAGRITNWREVGGEDEPIRAYQRNENSGSQSMMRRFMADDALTPAPSHLSSGSMGGLVRTIANYDNGRGAIGYSFRYYVTDLVGQYDVKLLSIEGVAPTIDNISDESYPITGDFYAVTRAGDDSPELARFIEWVRGPQGQELVEKSGYARLA